MPGRHAGAVLAREYPPARLPRSKRRAHDPRRRDCNRRGRAEACGCARRRRDQTCVNRRVRQRWVTDIRAVCHQRRLPTRSVGGAGSAAAAKKNDRQVTSLPNGCLAEPESTRPTDRSHMPFESKLAALTSFPPRLYSDPNCLTEIKPLPKWLSIILNNSY